MLDFGFYNMDCLEGMKQFPDNYFELAIVDPPYGDAGGGSAVKKDSENDSNGTVSRTGGTWAAKFGKKSQRGTLRRKRNISRSFSASHGIRSYGGGTTSNYLRRGAF